MLVKVYQQLGKNNYLHLKDIGVPFADGNLDIQPIWNGDVPVSGAELIKMIVRKRTTVRFVGQPLNGYVGLIVYNPHGYTITWPSNIEWASGSAPASTKKTQLYTFGTNDDGLTWIEIGAVWPLALCQISYEALAQSTYSFFKSYIDGYDLTYKNSKTLNAVSSTYNLKGQKGEDGAKGPTGDKGETGDKGHDIILVCQESNITDTPSILRTDNVVSEGQSPEWLHTYIFNIPKGTAGTNGLDNNIKGPDGDQGEQGDSPDLNVSSVIIGDNASAVFTPVSGNEYLYNLNMVIPKGEIGDKGEQGDTGSVPVLDFSVFTNTNDTFSISQTGNSINLSIPRYDAEQNDAVSNWSSQIFLKPKDTDNSTFTNGSIYFEAPLNGEIVVYGEELAKIECVENTQGSLRKGEGVCSAKMKVGVGNHYNLVGKMDTTQKNIETIYPVQFSFVDNAVQKVFPGAYYYLENGSYTTFSNIYFIHDVNEFGTSQNTEYYMDLFKYGIISNGGEAVITPLSYYSGWSYTDNYAEIQRTGTFNSTTLLIGHGLGGYYATQLAKEYNCYCLLLEPAIYPKTYINTNYKNTNPQSSYGVTTGNGTVTQSVVNSYTNNFSIPAAMKSKFGLVCNTSDTIQDYSDIMEFLDDKTDFADILPTFSWYNFGLIYERILWNFWCPLNSLTKNHAGNVSSFNITDFS